MAADDALDRSSERKWIEQTGVNKCSEYVFFDHVRADEDEAQWKRLQEQFPGKKLGIPISDHLAVKGCGSSNEYFGYVFMGDYFSHVASWAENGEGVRQILIEKCFRGGNKLIDGKEICLSWWGADVTTSQFCRKPKSSDSRWPSTTAANMKSEVKQYLRKKISAYWTDNNGNADQFKAELAAELGLATSTDAGDGSNAAASDFVLQRMSKIQEEIDNFLNKTSDNFGNSPAFLSSSRYGNFRFTLSFDKLIESYEKSFCTGITKKRKIVYRAATFRYTFEIMHVVFIHPDTPIANEVFKDFAVLDDDGPFSMDGGPSAWTWKPNSTGNATYYPTDWRSEKPRFLWRHFVPTPSSEKDPPADYRCWEHATVAFYMENREQKLRFGIDELIASLSICDSEKPYLGKKPKLTAREAKIALLDWAAAAYEEDEGKVFFRRLLRNLC